MGIIASNAKELTCVVGDSQPDFRCDREGSLPGIACEDVIRGNGNDLPLDEAPRLLGIQRDPRPATQQVKR
jgi:hypothetical protein